LDTLQKHALLAQETSDASIAAESLAHLLKCRQHYTSVMSLVQFGKLPEAVAAAMTLGELVGSAPIALERAAIMKDLKVCGWVYGAT
jgi:centromere/kinetochore protein ZW10